MSVTHRGATARTLADDGEAREPPPEIVARLARFEHTADPGALWPGLTEPMRLAALRRIERAASGVLAARRDVRLEAADDAEAYAIAIAAFTCGMGPMLARWAEDGRLALCPRLSARLAPHLAHGRRRAERMEREVAPALRALLARGITPIVLKGTHVGRVYLEEPGVRPTADVDISIPASRIVDAEAALRDAGFTAQTEPYDPYKRDWLGPGVDPRTFSLELSHARSRWILEMHASIDRRFDHEVVVRLDGEDRCVEPFELAGLPVAVLAQPLLLLTLACQCSQELHSIRLLRLVELVRVIRRDRANGRLDWDELLAMLRRTRSARFAWPALVLAEQLAPGTVDERVLALGRRESTRAARHTVARLVPAGGSFDDRGLLRQLMWATTPAMIARRVLSAIWPPGPGMLRRTWRLRIRRLFSGRLSLAAPPERAVTERPHSTPPPAAAE